MTEKDPFRVLIIDDSPTMRAVCQQALQREGLDTSVADSAETGYQALKEALEGDSPYDGLLLDWVLPKMSGAELLRKIGSEQCFDSLSVMIFTESPDDRAYQLASERPNNDIQHKEDLTLLPYRMRKFLSTYGGGGRLEDWRVQQFERSKNIEGGEILFVDDSKTVCAMYSSLLRNNGYQVTVANSMAEAIAIARQAEFQLAVVDYYMPNGNGDELCSALLSNPETSQITVVMHSQSRDVLEQALNAGAIDLIWKDDPANIFLMRIASIIRSLRVKHQAEQLDTLMAATHTLGVGMMIKQDDDYQTFNETMDTFSGECGGLEPFLPGNGEIHHRRVEDKYGKQRAFNLYSVEGSANREVFLVQDVTAMADALDLAESANQAKGDFLASVSHELRTPLTAIIGNSELLAESSLNEDQEQLLRSVEVSGKGLLSLINDILDLSKIEAGKFEIDSGPYNLSTLIEDVQHMFSIRAHDSGLNFEVEFRGRPMYQPIGDGRRIAQILINLLGNAIKFTEAGTVKLTVWVDQNLHFLVEDTGIGMTPEVLDRLFKPFEQADASISRRFGGAGLGLHISWSLTELMNGEIKVSSIPNRGSEFELTIPYQASEIREVDTPRSRRSSQPLSVESMRAHILIAEDTPSLQILERRIVESTGCTVSIAQNGREALEMATAERFDLILMDMQMPEMDGIQATRAIRDRGNDVPIVALTANVMQKHRDQFDQAGCDDFLAKPIDKQELISALKRHARTPASKEEEGVKDFVDDELLEIFYESTITDKIKLEEALARTDWPTVYDVAHTIKGTGSSFGFPQLTSMGKTVCDAIGDENIDQAATAAASMLQELERILP